jgi:hypothetical protein
MGIPIGHAAIYAQILPVRGEKMRLFGFFQQAGMYFGTGKRWAYDFLFL